MSKNAILERSLSTTVKDSYVVCDQNGRYSASLIVLNYDQWLIEYLKVMNIYLKSSIL